MTSIYVIAFFREMERRKRGGDEDFVKNVFEKFGDGETMSKAGFEKLLQSLSLLTRPYNSGNILIHFVLNVYVS